MAGKPVSIPAFPVIHTPNPTYTFDLSGEINGMEFRFDGISTDQLKKAGELFDDPLPQWPVEREGDIPCPKDVEDWFERNYERLKFLYESGVLG